MGQPQLVDQTEFNTIQNRVKNVSQLTEILSAWTSQFSKAEMAEVLGGQIPFGPVNNITDIFADPHAQSRGMVASIAVPEINRHATVANTPVRMDRTPGGVRHRAPLLDEHRAQIFKEFGIVD